MSCSRELRALLEDAQKATSSDYRAGYLDALREALEIVEAHEEDDE